MGLKSRHAYTITKVVEIKCAQTNGSIPLVRLRNPHGQNEWKGRWKDGDKMWKAVPDHLKSQLGLVFENDGEFYMSFRDHFLDYFGELEVCHLTPTDCLADGNDDTNAEEQKKFQLIPFKG